MELNNRKIDDYNIDGVNHYDAPEFVDAHFSWATFEDGTELDDAQLDQLTADYPDVISETIYGG